MGDPEVEKFAEKHHLSHLTLIAFKNDTTVYKADCFNRPVILKTHKKSLNYYREITSLSLLRGKNVRVPALLYCEMMEEDNEETGYLIEEFLQGNQLSEDFWKYTEGEKERVLYQAGEIMGMLNFSVPQKDILDCSLWRYAYEGITDFSSYNWIQIYLGSIQEWIDTVKKSKLLTAGLKQKIEFQGNLLQDRLYSFSENGTVGFVHRDYGFRNILVDHEKVAGIIDFEHAVLGDVTFDLSKIIFNDIDFERDKRLRNAFFEGWTGYTGYKIDWERLWLYLAIQGLGAIQWVENQRDYLIRIKNRSYMEKGIRILDQASRNI